MQTYMWKAIKLIKYIKADVNNRNIYHALEIINSP